MVVGYRYRGRCPRLLIVVPSRHQSEYGVQSVVGYYPQDGCLSLFIALRWMQRPERVMVGLTENIQACLRIFWQLQHQWLARDILHLPQGVFCCFCLAPSIHKLIRSIRLIRGRKSQLIQDGANEAEGLFRYFKRRPKEYSA